MDCLVGGRLRRCGNCAEQRACTGLHQLAGGELAEDNWVTACTGGMVMNANRLTRIGRSYDCEDLIF